MEQTVPYQVEETEEYLSVRTLRMEIRIKKLPWEVSTYLDGRLLTKEQIRDSNVDNMCKYLPIGFDCDEEGKVIRVRESMYMYSDEPFTASGKSSPNSIKEGRKSTAGRKMP